MLRGPRGCFPGSGPLCNQATIIIFRRLRQSVRKNVFSGFDLPHVAAVLLTDLLQYEIPLPEGS